jgi:hypothetical protein
MRSGAIDDILEFPYDESNSELRVGNTGQSGSHFNRLPSIERAYHFGVSDSPRRVIVSARTARYE